MHFLTALRMSWSRLSRARRWGSVRTGARGSCRSDSLITSLSRYSGSAKSCSRNHVIRFILEGREIRNVSLLHPSENWLADWQQCCVPKDIYEAEGEVKMKGHVLAGGGWGKVSCQNWAKREYFLELTWLTSHLKRDWHLNISLWWKAGWKAVILKRFWDWN